jgi:hypothetical protein
MTELVTIATYDNVAEAWIAKASLSRPVIPCFLVDNNIAAIAGFYAAIGGVKLQVSSEYLLTANQLLGEQAQDDPHTEDV